MSVFSTVMMGKNSKKMLSTTRIDLRNSLQVITDTQSDLKVSPRVISPRERKL